MKIQIRILAHKYVKRKNLPHPSSWNETKATNKDLLKRFHQRNINLSQQLYFPEVEDIARVERNDIVMILPPATPISTAKRSAGIFKFLTDLSKYKV